ncbi:MAG TPA: glycosyl hydrolase [Verrucomicrobiae bacterium]|nr:glycosyl hydrolase [Verrucomicrobiae bacterium]
MKTHIRECRRAPMLALAVTWILAAITSPSLHAALEDSFRQPPAEAKPLTWWHWLNGTITKEGITLDLEAIKRAGLGGCYLFNCGGLMPEGDVRFMQPKWLEMMDHTIREAERLGLKFGVHNCDGFSQSGGPWITPETSMKELTWTTADAGGPTAFDAVLAQPEMKEGFYRDIAVVAFPLPEGGPLAGATLRGSIGEAELKKLTDGDEKTRATFPVPAGESTIDFIFPDARTVRSLSVRNFDPHRWEEDFPMRLEVSDDGKAFRTMGEFTANWDFQKGGAATAAFEEATGKVFRVAFKNPIPVQIGEIELSGAAKVHFAEAKAGRLRSRGHGAEAHHHLAYPGPDRNRPLAPGLVVARDAVRDLTGKMAADGRLRWDVPAGRWRILRVGFTSNGHHVSPATEEGRGLECDKLDPKIIRFHLDQYVGKLLERAGAAAGKTFAAVEIDSWECGIQNWTAGLEARFRERVGYDLLPFMPALLEGRIVDGADITERALWDWRRFLADQFSESYFSQAGKYLREKGVTYVGESTGRQQYLYDVAYIRNSDVTMGEFWIDSGPGQGVRVDNKVASSIAHVAGKRIVASESYTSSPGAARWQNHPFSLKAEGDRAFCAGVNQFVFHTFAHQPYPATGPGFTFFFWGLNFNRGNTWWDAADAWMAYLTRCNHILRQGQSVADVLWFVGEDVPNRIAWRDELRPTLPRGYDFDGCDTAALMAAGVKDGRICLPYGTDYRLLLLPSLPTMRPAIARKIQELAEAGAVVVAPRRPLQSPSLRDRGEGDATVAKCASALWGEGGAAEIDRKVGEGRLFAGLPFEEIFKRLEIAADFEYATSEKDAEILYVHRRAEGAEVYFLSNQQNRVAEFDAMFRVGARAPELWDPATGAIARPGVFRDDGKGRVCIPLRLDPNGSVFVVFREGRAGRHAVAIQGPTPNPINAPTAPVPPAGLDKAEGTFTLALWVKPNAVIPLPEERKVAVAFQKQNWAVFAPQGQQQFGDGHAGAGIAAGSNGIVAFEHSARYAPAVITFPAEIRERTHVALVYRDGMPTLFVNGREARAGTKGPHVVHAALSAGGPAFRGERSAPMLFDRALAPAEIAALANAKPLPTTDPPAVELERAEDGKLFARAWKARGCTAVLADGTRANIAEAVIPDLITLAGPWRVSFPPNLGAPASATFDTLISWPEHKDPGIRFFSGTATYENEFDIPSSSFGENRELYLDLGEVAVIARATLNGKELPTLWKPPFRTRIDGTAKPGRNHIAIRVTNLWPNRMIGDANMPGEAEDIEWRPAGKGTWLPKRWPDWLVQGKTRPSGRIAFCTRKDVYSKNDPLLPSGLIGPVRIRVAVVRPLD